MARKDIPLGKILHIIDGEAITRPNKPFKGKGAAVVLPNLKKIGILGDPFGPVDQPYQPIILDNPNDDTIIDILAIAQFSKKKN